MSLEDSPGYSRGIRTIDTGAINVPYTSSQHGLLPNTRKNLLRLSATKVLRAHPELSQISEVIFVRAGYNVFFPAFYAQPVLSRR